MTLKASIKRHVRATHATLKSGGLIQQARLLRKFGTAGQVISGVEVFVSDTPGQNIAAVDDLSRDKTATYFGHLEVTPDEDALEVSGAQFRIATVSGTEGDDGKRLLTALGLQR